MSSQTNELHVQPVDYESLVQKVAENVKMTVGRDNTSLAYDPKKVEFLEFCDALYSKEHNPRLVTVEKQFTFMYYTDYRKKVGGGRYPDKKKKQFNLKEFEDIINNKIVIDDVIGYQSFNQHYCAIKELLGHQRQLHQTELRNDELKTESMNNLIKHVQNRGEIVSRKIFKERLDGTFAPFKLASEVNTIEKYIWEDHNNTSCFSGASLRDRFQFLMTLGSISRSESLYKADLCDFIFKQRREIDPYRCSKTFYIYVLHSL